MFDEIEGHRLAIRLAVGGIHHRHQLAELLALAGIAVFDQHVGIGRGISIGPFGDEGEVGYEYRCLLDFLQFVSKIFGEPGTFFVSLSISSPSRRAFCSSKSLSTFFAAISRARSIKLRHTLVGLSNCQEKNMVVDIL